MNLLGSVDEMILSGLDDWVDAAEVAYIAKAYGGASTDEEIRQLSIEIIREVIEKGLMRTGDITQGGFKEWDLSDEEIVERINSEWTALGRRPNLGEICWLENTEEGNRRARQLSEKN